MSAAATPAEDQIPPDLDLLAVIRRSGVLPSRQYDDVRSKVLGGSYPHDPKALANALVRDGLLTDYQIRRFLRGKSHGLVVNRYVIQDRIGSGSMGRVYMARHVLMDRLAAIKVVSPDNIANPRILSRFQREMRLVGRLDHPNVVRAFDADQLGELMYIVMEYVPGMSLGQRLKKRGPMPVGESVDFIAQAAAGLHHAHQQGVIHRDIKPSNLLLRQDRLLKVADLGLAVLVNPEEGLGNDQTFQTQQGIAVGTIDYMSPEQATGKELDGRSDVFSLGCTMYHLISGRIPFPGDSQIERLGARINNEHTPILEYRPSLPRNIVRVLDRMMANSPGDRYQSAAEASEALDALLKRKRQRSSAAIGQSAFGSTEEVPHFDPEASLEEQPDHATSETPENSAMDGFPSEMLGAEGTQAPASSFQGALAGITPGPEQDPHPIPDRLYPLTELARHRSILAALLILVIGLFLFGSGVGLGWLLLR